MSSPRLIKIVVFADYMCPYSYFGHKALSDAIAECSHSPVTFNVEYRPFRLNATLPDETPLDRQLYFTQKYGDKYVAMQEVIQRMAQAMGLKIAKDGQLSQSTRAHRLAVKAYKVGGQDMQQLVIQTYFEAYFGEGKDIGNLDLLGDIAQSVGLMDKAEAISFLRSNELSDEVEETIGMARRAGLKGSPATIIDGKFRLDGVQTKDTFVQVFKRLGKCPDAMAGSPPCSETSSDGTISPPGRVGIVV